MRQAKCVDFLQWAMPRLGLNWAGFQRVHRQVCKRLNERVAELGLADFDAYRNYLLDHEPEWATVDACCRVTVSRFYRDKALFDELTARELPRLAAAARARGASALRAWSAGCAAGEEPYSLVLAWKFAAARRFPSLRFEVVATDVDEVELVRARQGCYRPSSLRELPATWKDVAFTSADGLLCLNPAYQGTVEFHRQDIRADAPTGPFDLILCRNLAFTYFDLDHRRHVLSLLIRELVPDGTLVVGRRERLPDGVGGLVSSNSRLRIFRRAQQAAAA